MNNNIPPGALYTCISGVSLRLLPCLRIGTQFTAHQRTNTWKSSLQCVVYSALDETKCMDFLPPLCDCLYHLLSPTHSPALHFVIRFIPCWLSMDGVGRLGRRQAGRPLDGREPSCWRNRRSLWCLRLTRSPSAATAHTG